MLTDIQKSYAIKESTNILAICERVCNCLGYGANGRADIFVYEIAKAESGAGTIKDGTPNGAGAGIFQHDEIPFYDNQSRYEQRHIIKVIDSFNINMRKVSWEDLLTDIEAGAIATRLHFKPFKEEIPEDIVGRGQYWKKYYNTEAGKGTVKHYLEMNGFNMSLYSVDMEVVF